MDELKVFRKEGSRVLSLILLFIFYICPLTATTCPCVEFNPFAWIEFPFASRMYNEALVSKAERTDRRIERVRLGEEREVGRRNEEDNDDNMRRRESRSR